MIQSPCGQKTAKTSPASSSILCINKVQKCLSCFFSVKMAFWQLSSQLTLWAGPRFLRVHGPSCATYIAMFHCVCWKILVRGIWVHFDSSMITLICSSSKVVLGNGDLDSKLVVSALSLVSSWRVTYGQKDILFRQSYCQSSFFSPCKSGSYLAPQLKLYQLCIPIILYIQVIYQ